MVINAWIFDEEGEMHDRLIDLEDLKLFGVIEERSNEDVERRRTDD